MLGTVVSAPDCLRGGYARRYPDADVVVCRKTGDDDLHSLSDSERDLWPFALHLT